LRRMPRIVASLVKKVTNLIVAKKRSYAKPVNDAVGAFAVAA